MKNSSMAVGLAVIGLVASLSVLIVVLFLSTGGGMMGWNGGHMMDGEVLSSTGMIATLISVIVLLASITYLIFWLVFKKEHKKNGIVQSQYPTPYQQLMTQPLNNASNPSIVEKQTDSPDEHIISKLLVGDERSLYQMIASSDGEMLQKDIVAKKVFSKAKVTRLLDKLEERGVIVRERYGATNKIRLIR